MPQVMNVRGEEEWNCWSWLTNNYVKTYKRSITTLTCYNPKTN